MSVEIESKKWEIEDICIQKSAFSWRHPRLVITLFRTVDGERREHAIKFDEVEFNNLRKCITDLTAGTPDEDA